MPDYRDLLRGIRTFPSLIKFLRDELDWPISSSDFEELTFDYTPEELGIDTANAAKIQEIKRLRPLAANQPWGIFFIKFEPKRLPIVALRRILSRVVVQKRASASSAERAAWQADDLLFVSNYGEGNERQISFAHFAQHEQKNDLPTLKVLGWDNRDTPLHLDGVADVFSARLTWPADEDDAESWRETWRSAFTLQHREVITTAKILAVRLAELARAIRDCIRAVLAIETEHGPVTKLMKAFQQALIHDLNVDDFADMYAQTIAYGLLSARVANPAHDTAAAVAEQIPVTNPFLKELLETFLHLGGRKGKTQGGEGIDFDELGVSEVVELLDAANMEAVVRDFGDRNREEDPVIHFYELFLKEYDAKKRMQRGVFYTPQPVVSYIVRSVHELLQSEFGLEDGLASTVTWGEMAAQHAGLQIPNGVEPTEPFVQILDPATGTATFLVEVIDVIHRTLATKWKQQRLTAAQQRAAWNDYVPKHLLPRLHGYELMMAPYAIAHMKIGLKLYETGYRFGSDARARIYLTNTLEPPGDDSKQMSFAEWAPALAHEAQAVNAIKRHQRFTVVIGNPPYAGHSVNNHIPQIVDLVYDYKRGLAELERPGQAKWLQDDYVKFIRFAECTLQSVPMGLLGYITNHSYLDNPTFKGMRRHILTTFSEISVIDLHGNTKKKERSADGTVDENVFDIQQGVAIMLAQRGAKGSTVRSRNLFGTREQKYGWLDLHSDSSMGSQVIAPIAPIFLFRAQDRSLADEYEVGVPLPELMGVNGEPAPGVVTTHDEFAISWSAAEAAEKVETLLRTKTEAEARSIFTLCSQSQWNYVRAKAALADDTWRKQIVPILYRPFDVRWTVFNQHVAVHRRERVMRHMLGRHNIGLICTRQTKDQWGVIVASGIVAHKTCGAYDINFLFPLYVLPGSDELNLDPDGNGRPNVSPSTAKRLGDVLELPINKQTGLPERLAPEDVFNYAYAVFHSPGYRSRYAEFLKIDFPRLPLTRNLEMFRELAHLGSELVALHLLESPRLDQPLTTYIGAANPEVKRVGWANNAVWLDAPTTPRGATAAPHPGTIGFHGVPAAVWNFHIGGYQVCEKWLKDRKGRTLSQEDIAHYHRIVVALAQTIWLMEEIDGVIDRHGGWPEAFNALIGPEAI